MIEEIKKLIKNKFPEFETEFEDFLKQLEREAWKKFNDGKITYIKDGKGHPYKIFNLLYPTEDTKRLEEKKQLDISNYVTQEHLEKETEIISEIESNEIFL